MAPRITPERRLVWVGNKLMTAEAARRIRGRRLRRGNTVYETPRPEHAGPWSACAE
jgi:hypothetical protein